MFPQEILDLILEKCDYEIIAKNKILIKQLSTN